MNGEGSFSRTEQLEAQLASLAGRVWALEQEMTRLRGPVSLDPIAAPPLPIVSVPESEASPVLPTFAATEPKAPRASLETRLGSHVFNRIGIVALLIGCAWFLKLAIDNRWIGPVGRVLVGLLAGAGVIVWSERFRHRGFTSFSYSLKAIGSGVLYLSLWASFQLYHLLPAPSALTAMLLVVAWNAFMAWSQDAELLAAYALAGAMLTPGLLSTGGNHETFLFTYLLGIDLATLVLVRLKQWPRLLAGAFPATVLYYAGWFGSFYRAQELVLTAAFAILLAAVFVTASIGTPVEETASRTRDAFGPTLRDILLPLGNGVFIALALYTVLDNAGHHDGTAWAMLALAAIYLAVLRLPQPRITAGVHLSLAVVLLSVAIPLKANGRWIIVAWLVEGVALLLLTHRNSTMEPDGISEPLTRLLGILALGALTLGWLGAVVQLYDGRYVPHAFLNPRFATALTAVAVFAAASRTVEKIAQPSPNSGTANGVSHIAAILTVATNLLAILAGVREVVALWHASPSSPEAQLQSALAVSTFLMLYGAALLAAGFIVQSALLRWQALVLLLFTILKTFLYDMRSLSQGYRVASFLALGVLLMTVSFAYQNDWLSLRERQTAP